MTKKNILLSITALIFISIPAIFYIYYFGLNTISKNPSDWGPFGDYFGGILNPIISILTLIVTIYIAIEISKIEDKRNEKTLNFEKRRFLNELRENEYRRISLELQKLSLLKLDNQPGEETYNILMQMRFFQEYNLHIFPFLREKLCQEVILEIDSLYVYLRGNSFNDSVASKMIISCIDKGLKFTERLQQYIISEM
jgi:uncharacterized membrane protein